MKKRHLKLILLGTLIFCLGQATVSFADKVCFQCHDRQDFNKKITHKPVAEDKCIVCHNPHAARYGGLLQKQVKDLCYSCHPIKTAEERQKVVHQPVSQGKCLACHSPHGSDENSLLRSQLAASCFSCHKELNQKYKFSHSPFAKGLCLTCHLPHRAANEMLLKEDEKKLCSQQCHDQETITKRHKGFPREAKNCLSCHNPHGSDQKSLMQQVLHEPFKEGCAGCHEGAKIVKTDACLGCHEEIGKQRQALHTHLTDDKNGNSCIRCHSPHAGSSGSLLKGTQRQICGGCHQDTLARHAGSLYEHQAIGKCDNCHSVHGANQLAMLKGDGNAVCINCHASQGQFSHPVGELVKDPRNGQMITCVTCHDPKGTEFKFELKLNGQKELCVQCHRY